MTTARRPVHVLVYHPDEAAEYAALFRPPRRVVAHVATTPDEAARVAPEIDVAYAWKLPPAFYGKAPRLRWLHAMGAGVDWALLPDLPARVTITRVPGVFGPWMTEYVLGWCAFVAQKMEIYRTAQRERRWNDRVIPGRLGGTTMVVVGLGDIGRTVARGARALGMRVVGVNRKGSAVPGVERVVATRALRRALIDADWVVLTLPLTPETRGLIGAAELAAMKSNAWLINVARGAIVDEAALVEALRRRTLAGAVLDVFAQEPLPADHPLWALANVVITPHISGPSTPRELAPVFDDNLARFLSGRPLRHVVDRRRGY